MIGPNWLGGLLQLDPDRIGVATPRAHQSGRSKHWIKVKNRKHHAFDRVQEAHRRWSYQNSRD
jgi:hypothetical protein